MKPLSRTFGVNNMADEVIGKRVICEGFRGVIKYVGEVPPTSGKWADYLFNSINNEIKECLCALKSTDTCHRDTENYDSVFSVLVECLN